MRPLFTDSRFPDRRQKETARIAQTAIELPPMQKGQASISRVKATDREGDAARTEGRRTE